MELDRLSKLITTSTIAITAFTILLMIYLPLPTLFKLAISALLIFTILVSYLFSPRRIRVEDGSVIVERPIGKVVIPLEGARIRKLDRLGFRTLRLFGSGGLFGYFGLFYSSGIGKFYLYSGRRKNLTLIETGEKRYVIGMSPEELGLRET